MPMKRLLEYDTDNLVTQTFEYNDQDDTFTIHRAANVGPQIEQNKQLASVGDGWNDDKSFRLAAIIPPDIQYEWLSKFGVRAWDRNHAGKVRALLDSNEYRYLRIGHFMLGKHHD